MEGISSIPKTLRMHYKKGWSQQQKSFSNSESEHKDHLKNSFKLRKIEKGENTVSKVVKIKILRRIIECRWDHRL